MTSMRQVLEVALEEAWTATRLPKTEKMLARSSRAAAEVARLGREAVGFALAVTDAAVAAFSPELRGALRAWRENRGPKLVKLRTSAALARFDAHLAGVVGEIEKSADPARTARAVFENLGKGE